jgi:hypothetical protein
MNAHPVIKLLVLSAGALLVLAAATDAVSTLVTTQRRSSRLWPTYVFYRRTWRLWRALGRRITSERGRERLLAVYGPLSLLGLLVVWVLLLLAGWGLVWWMLRGAFSGVGGYLDAVYFAGVGFFTVGFGDVVPVGGLARLLALAQAFMGLVTIALVIGYLPTLFGAYSRREAKLLTLDDLSEEHTTSTGSSSPGTPTAASVASPPRSPTGSGGAQRCSTAIPPTRCWPSSAPGSPGSTG